MLGLPDEATPPTDALLLYGTLLDRDVMALVLGRVCHCRYLFQRLCRVIRFRGCRAGSYPIAVPDPQGEVSGATVRGFSTRDVARLAAFEGSSTSLKVRGGGTLSTVSVFEPLVKLKPTDRPHGARRSGAAPG